MKRALLLVCLLWALPAQATEYFVSTSGNDSNSCATATSSTQTNQKRNIVSGVGCLTVPGDKVTIHTGTYDENIIDSSFVAPGTSWAAFMTVQGFAGETVTIRPTGGEGILLLSSANHHVLFKHLKIDGTVQLETADCVQLNTNNIHLEDVEVHHCGRNGILVGTTSSDFQFLNVKVHHAGWSTNSVLSNGVYNQGDRLVILGGEYYQNECFGVRFWASGSPVAINNIIQGARIYENGDGVGLDGAADCSGTNGGGGLTIGETNPLVKSNLIYGNGGWAITMGFSSAVDAQIYNNTFYNNAFGIEIAVGGTGADVRGNIFWMSGTISNLGTGSTVTPNHTTDPSFTNAAGADFTLLTGSTARDLAPTIALVTVDFLNASRPQGPFYDYGAYEFVVGGSGGGVDGEPGPLLGGRRGRLHR